MTLKSPSCDINPAFLTTFVISCHGVGITLCGRAAWRYPGKASILSWKKKEGRKNILEHRYY
jgi:hypothetical protein